MLRRRSRQFIRAPEVPRNIAIAETQYNSPVVSFDRYRETGRREHETGGLREETHGATNGVAAPIFTDGKQNFRPSAGSQIIKKPGREFFRLRQRHHLNVAIFSGFRQQELDAPLVLIFRAAAYNNDPPCCHVRPPLQVWRQTAKSTDREMYSAFTSRRGSNPDVRSYRRQELGRRQSGQWRMPIVQRDVHPGLPESLPKLFPQMTGHRNDHLHDLGRLLNLAQE